MSNWTTGAESAAARVHLSTCLAATHRSRPQDTPTGALCKEEQSGDTAGAGGRSCHQRPPPPEQLWCPWEGRGAQETQADPSALAFQTCFILPEVSTCAQESRAQPGSGPCAGAGISGQHGQDSGPGRRGRDEKCQQMEVKWEEYSLSHLLVLSRPDLKC